VIVKVFRKYGSEGLIDAKKLNDAGEGPAPEASDLEASTTAGSGTSSD